MRKLIVLSIMITMCIFIMSANVQATIIGGPGPAGFSPDDGTETFSVGQDFDNVQLVDELKNEGFTTSFGFYFADSSNPSPTLIEIFGADDIGADHTARVDFLNQIVTDEDLGGVEELDFSSLSGSGDIGFYYFADLSSIGIGSFLLYTEASRNGGVDTVATFHNLLEPDNYILGFELLNPVTQEFQTLSVEMVLGVTPVPEPGTLLMLSSGLIGLAVIRRNKK